MALLTPEQMQDDTLDKKTLSPGETANIVITKYDPFMYGPNKDKEMKKYLARNADTGAELEFVGFAFHDCVKELNDSLNFDETVIKVECIDNSSKYPDFKFTVVAGEKTDSIAF